MTHTYRELIIGGVLIARIVSYAAAMLFIIVMLRPLLHLIRAIFGLLTLLFFRSIDDGSFSGNNRYLFSPVVRVWSGVCQE